MIGKRIVAGMVQVLFAGLKWPFAAFRSWRAQRALRTVARVKGFWRNRKLVVDFPAAQGGTLVVLPTSELRGALFEQGPGADGTEVFLRQLHARPEERVTIARFSEAAAAAMAVRAISNALAPNPMRWVWRLLVVFLLYTWLSSPAPVRSLQPPIASTQPAPQVPAAPTAQRPTQDPFGLKINP